MGFDFTIAVVPELTNIDKELQYIKSALLYADQIFLISPISYMYTQLSSQTGTFDERNIIRILKYLLPLCKEQEPETYRDGMALVERLSSVMLNKRYKAVPMAKKIELRNQLKTFVQEIDKKCIELIGECQAKELGVLWHQERLF